MTTYPNFDASKSYIGECQVCGSFQVVNKGHLVLHGYQRPGDGAINGRCWGETHVPFELSCEVAKEFHKRLVEQTLPAAYVRLNKLQEPGLDQLMVSIANGYTTVYTSRFSHRETVTKMVVIHPGYVHEKMAENDYKAGTTFEQFRKSAIASHTKYIVQLVEHRDQLARKIAGWKYAPEALKTREAVKAEEKAAAENKKVVRAFNAAWKDMWQFVARAIGDHKNGYNWDAKDKEAFAKLPPFPTNKERAAARKGK